MYFCILKFWKSQKKIKYYDHEVYGGKFPFNRR